MMDFHAGPQTGPGVLIIPVYLFVAWFLFGATVAFYYGIKQDNQKAGKGLLYSLLALAVAGFAYGIWHGVKTGKWFTI